MHGGGGGRFGCYCHVVHLWFNSSNLCRLFVREIEESKLARYLLCYVVHGVVCVHCFIFLLWMKFCMSCNVQLLMAEKEKERQKKVAENREKHRQKRRE